MSSGTLSRICEVVDPRGPRFSAATTSVVLAVVLIVGPGWGPPLRAVQVLAFAALGHVDLVFHVAIGLALVAALLNAVFGFCLGCELYLPGRRVLARIRPAAERRG